MPKKIAGRRPSAPPLTQSQVAELSRRLDQSNGALDRGDLSGALAALSDIGPPLAAHPAYRAQRASVLARRIAKPAALAEAERLFRGLVADGVRDPSIAVNFGALLKILGKFGQAAKVLKEAIAAWPEIAAAHSGLAAVRYEQGAWAEAEASFRAALERAPGDARSARGLGHLRLGAGDFAEGWRAYAERRRLLATPLPPGAPPDLPIWDGTDATPEPTLLWREQGVGEQILFSGLAPELAAAGVAVDLMVDTRLQALLQRSLDGVTVLADAAALDPSRYRRHGPVGALGAATRPDAARCPPPRPTLQADPTRTDAMRRWLEGLGPGLKLGVSWRSESTRAAGKKSIPIERWGPILKREGVRFIDLQYGPTADERAEAQRRFGVEIASHPDLDRKDDIDGLAALIAALDGVVTISNVTAHLAGALGAKTLLLLSKSHFWYWGYEGGDRCRWYPGIEIIRRDDPGLDASGWSGVVSQAARRLEIWRDTRAASEET